jgi:ATP-dependent Zn protease
MAAALLDKETLDNNDIDEIMASAEESRPEKADAKAS